MDYMVEKIGDRFCAARRESDGCDGGCPVVIMGGKDSAPSRICPRCEEDVRFVLALLDGR